MNLSYIVEESVNNGESFRYYEMQPVLNRPNLMRVTFYAKNIDQRSSLDLVSSFGNLGQFIQQSNSQISLFYSIPSISGHSITVTPNSELASLGMAEPVEEQPEEIAQEVKEVAEYNSSRFLEALGPFSSECPEKILLSNVVCISDYKSLMHRYDKKNASKLRPF